jgi:hypothetical protein
MLREMNDLETRINEMKMSSKLKDSIKMRTWIRVQEKTWAILLFVLWSLCSTIVSAQNVPGCDPLGQSPVADFRLTYDPVTNRYTTWYVPTNSSPHRLTSSQFTIVTPNGFTTPRSNGRDANLQITNLNGSWVDQVFDNELIASVGRPPLPALNGYAVHQVGKGPAGDDVDPDGPTGPLDSESSVTAGVPVPLFSFPGTGCSSVVRVLVNGEPIQQQMLSGFGNNFNNQLSYTTTRSTGTPTINRYCKNDAQSIVNLVLPDILNDTVTVCATNSTYSNNYLTQVFRNWNPANLPVGTIVIPANVQKWDGYSVSPASLSANVSINPTTGAYTVTFPTVGGVTQPGSVTICNTLRDSCNTAFDQACVIVSWLSSGTVSITNNSPVCLSNGIATIALTATAGFTDYKWIGPGLNTTTGNPVSATVSTAGVYSYTVEVSSGGSCTASNTTSVTVINGPEITSITPVNPTSCSGTTGSLTLNGLVPGQSYSIIYTQNGVNPVTQTLTADGSGQILISGLSAGIYSFTASNGACTSTPISTTLSDPGQPATPTLSANPSATICLGSSLTLTATGAAGASFAWTGANLSQSTGNPVMATPTTSGSLVYMVTQTVGGCVSAPASVTIQVNPAPVVDLVAFSSTVCVGGTIDLTANVTTGTVPPYNYAWSGPNFATTTTINTVSVLNATLANSGSYTVVLTDANGCTATASTPIAVTVINCCSLTATAASNQPTVCVGSSVTLSVTTAGSIGALSYQWSPNVTPGTGQSVVVMPTVTTTYTVVVTDMGAPNCSRIATVTIQVNPTPIINLRAFSSTICVGNSIDLTTNVTTGTLPPYSFVWSGPNFTTTTTINTVSIPNATTANSGSYTVVLTDANGCTATASTPVAVTVTPLPTFTLSPSNPSSCSGTNGSISINGLTNGQIYTISYSQNGTGTQSSSQIASAGQILISNLTAGVYSITVALNGCPSAPQSVTLTDPTPPIAPMITPSPSATICLGGSVLLTATGTNLQWVGTNLSPLTGSPVTATPGSSGSFIYTVTQTVSGCLSLPASVTVVVNPNPSITSLTAPPTCMGQPLSLSATITGGTPQYNVSWRTPDGLTLAGNPLVRPNAQVSMGGAYTVTVSDNNSCTATQVVSTTVGLTPNVQVQPQLACAGGDITLTATGGSGNYFWSGPNGFTATGQVIVLNNIDISDAGSYTVVITGSNSCTGTAIGVVAVNQGPVVKAGFVSTTVCVGSTLFLVGDVTTGSIPPYQYSWTGPNGFASTSQNPTISPAQVSNSGSYTFVVTDLNGCSATATTPVAVTVLDCCPPREAQISFTPKDPGCGSTDGTAQATLLPASAPGVTVSYLWKNVATNAVVGTTQEITGLVAGVYSVTITETSGSCVQHFTGTVALSESPGPDVDLVSVAGANCGAANGSTTLTITGGSAPYAISWTGAASGSTTASVSPVQINGLVAGNYSFFVTGAGSSCQGVQNVSIPVLSTSLSLSVSVSQPITCGSSATVVVSWNSVGGPYQLTVDGVTSPVTGTSQTLILSEGTHSIQIASGNPLCVSDSKVVVINAVPAPLVAGWSVTQPVCAGQSGLISFAGGQSSGTQYTLSYLNGAQIGVSAGNVPQSYSLGGGIYEVTRLEPNGCVSSQTLELISPLAISFNIQPTAGLCGQSGSLVVTNISGGVGGYTITYGGPVSGSAAEGVLVNGLPAGGYTVTVMDSKGCVISKTFSLSTTDCSVPCKINLNVIATSGHCGQSDGSATVTASGGSGNYTYLWSTGATTPTITGQPTGVYSVTVRDAVSSTCVSTTQVAIGNEGGPQLVVLSTTPATCAGATGSASVTAMGGSPVYTYLWSNGQSSATLSGVVAGTYSVTVTDQTGCRDVGLVTILSSPGTLTATASGTPSVCLQSTGSASVVASGGSGPGTYQYRWSNGGATPTISNLVAGVYSVTVTDANQCWVMATVSIDDLSGPQFTINKTNVSCSGGSNGTASVNISNAFGIPSYQWSTGAVTGSISGLSAGVYSVTVTDGNGCQVTDQVTITQPGAIVAELSSSTLACGSTTGTILLNSISGGTPTYRYLWSNGVTSANLTNVSVGSYSLTVTDANGCVAIGTATISLPVNCTTCPAPVLTVTSPVCNTAAGTYSVSYNVSTGSSVTVLGGTLNAVLQLITVTQGQSVTVIATNGCGDQSTTTVLAPTCPVGCTSNAGLSVGQAICSGTTTYVASVTANAGATIQVLGGGSYANGVVTSPVGTNVTVVATLGCNVERMVIMSPTDCPGVACENPLVSLSGPSCEGTTYSVHYVVGAGVTVTSTPGVGVLNPGLQTITGIPAGVGVSLTATNGSCTQVVPILAPTNCPVECQKPILTVGNPICNGNTYSIHFYVGSSGLNTANVTSDAGTIAGNIITGIQIGTSVKITASTGVGCESTITVESPISCTTGCVPPQLTVGQPICYGTTYAVSFAVDPGISVSANAGNIIGNLITNIQAGTNLTITAGTGSCVTRIYVVSPDCSNPCLNPGISLSGPICRPGGVTYYFNYTATAGTTVTISQGGTVNEATGTIEVVAGIAPFAMPSLLVSTPGCPISGILLPPASCTFCSKPTLTVGSPVCNGNTYSVTFSSSTTNVSANAGTISGNTISGIQVGIPVVITANGGVDCVNTLTVESPIVCPMDCVSPQLSVGQPICGLIENFYVVSFAAAPGFTVISTNGGVVNMANHTITLPLGVSAVVSAGSGNCLIKIDVVSPTNCSTPCVNPGISVGGAVCEIGTNTYSVNFTTTTGTIVIPSSGQLNQAIGKITGIALGTPLSLTVSVLPIADFTGTCPDKVIMIPSPTNCPTCLPRSGQISFTPKDPGCGSSDGTAQATLLPASAPGVTVSYLWKNVATNAVVGTTQEITGLVAGVYSVTITETSGSCVQHFTGTVALSESPGPDVDLVSVAGANCGAANGSTTLTITGGSAPYAISWTGAASGSTTASVSPVQINGLVAGNYSFFVTGAGSSCQGVQNVSIPVLSTSLSLSVSVSQPITCGSSATVVVSWNSVGGPYQLTVDGVTSPVTGTSQTLILSEGTHSIQIASGNPLCVSDSKVVVINAVPAPLVAGWSVTQPVCAGQSGLISFAGGQSSGTQYTLSYLNGAQIGVSTGNVPQSYSLGGGIYEVTRLEPNGCVSSQTLELISPLAISFNIQPTAGLCGQSGSLVVTNISGGVGGYTITYGGPVSGSAAEGVLVNGLPAGGYTVTVMDSKGCVISKTFSLSTTDCSVPCKINLNVIATSGHCGQSDGSATVTASGGSGNYTYLWSTGATTPTITGQPTGVYSVTVRDAVSSTCVSTTQVAIGNEGGPQLVVLSTTPATCAGATGSASVTAMGGSPVYTYLWSNGQSSATLSGVVAGTYSVTVTDQTGCRDVGLVTILSSPGTLTATASGTPSVCLQSTGSASVVASGGSGPGTYQYRWSNGGATPTISNLVAGVYSVTVTDANQCWVMATVSIDDLSGPQFTINKTNVSCSGGSNGTASVNISNAFGIPSYQWSTGAVTGSISGLSAGVYSVTVTDGNGCQVTDQVTITQPGAIVAELSSSTLACGSTTGTILLNSISGGTPTYRYLWSNGVTSANLTNVSVGSYSLTVTDANGCVAIGTATISLPVNCTTCPAPVLTVTSPVCNTAAGTYSVSYNVSTGSSVTVLGGTLNAVLQLITVTQGQSVTVIATNGCGDQSTTTVLAPTCPVGCTSNAGLSVGQAICSGTTTYVASVTANAGATIQVLGGGSYANGVVTSPVGTNVTVVATLGCNVERMVIMSPTDCPGVACENPLVSLSGPSCEGTTYSVHYVVGAGVTVTSTPGVGVLNPGLQTITGIPAGVGVSLTATNGSCTQVVPILAPTNCPTSCPAPVLTVTSPVCNTASGTYSVSYNVSVGSSVTALGGTLNAGLQLITVTQGQSVTVIATNGCGDQSTTTVLAPTCPVGCTSNAGLSVGQAICSGTTTYVASVTASGGATIQVLGGGSYANGVVTSPVGTNVTVVATLGCNVERMVIMSPTDCPGVACENPLVSLSGPSCEGTTYSVHYVVGAGVTVTSTPGVGVLNPGLQTITGIPAGVGVSLTATNGSCTQVVPILAPTDCPTSCPTIAVISTDPTTCTANNGSLTLTGLTSGQSYTVCYTKSLNAPLCQSLVANQNGRIVISGLGVGVYANITVGQNGCMSNALSATLSGGLPAPSATCSVTAVCAGQSVILTASGTNIQWYGPGLLTSTGSPVTAIPNVTGIVTYTVVQSANGCVSPPAMVTVVVKPTPTFSVTATNPTVCNSSDGSMTLIGLTPGQSYTVCYTKDSGLPVCAERLANANGLLTISGLTAGMYTNITVNELGCLSAPKTVTLINPALPNPEITVAPSTTICLGQALSLTATGQPGAVFTWKGQGLLGTTGSIVTVNPQSTGTLSYTVTQTIAGCGSSWVATTIMVNPVPSAVLITKTDPNSCANPNGSITMGGLLANQNYTVCYRVNNVGSSVCQQLLSTGTGNITLNGLTAGAYSVTVSSGGCSSLPVSATLVGQTPAQPNVTVMPNATICIGQSVTLTASSDVEGTFLWSGPDLSGITGGILTVTPTATGVWTYTVTQSVNGCTSIPAIVSVTVMAIPAPTVVATTAPTTCLGTTGSITLGGLTGNQSYTVCYSNNGSAALCAPFVAGANGQLVVAGLNSGAYSLTVLSAGGCHNTVPVSASVASSTACSVCTDAPLIVVQPMLICKDSTKTVSMHIIDGDVSDSFTATACGVGMSNATVTVGMDNQTRQLFVTYKAAPGFVGIDQVCVTVTDKCGNFDQVYVPIQVIRCVCECVGKPPVVIPEPIITTKNNPKEICVPIIDTPTDTHTATVCGGPQHGTVEISVNNQTHMLCVKYTPNTNYVGIDKVCITICDQTNRCTVIEVPITVIDIPNPPAVSVVPIVTNCSSTTSAQMPILDINIDNTHSVMVISQPLNGTITATVFDQINHRILITYTPAPGFTGSDKAVIRVTDSDGLVSEDTDIPLMVMPGTCPTCVTLELKVLLEGPYNMTTHKMDTVLNYRGLLPGQTTLDPSVIGTPAGQPYNTAPWNYTGTESVTSYDQDIVDWVLVSLRTDALSTTPVFRVAGLLHSDGRITFVNPCFSIPVGDYHAVVEHRNHMGVMSPTKVSIVNNKLQFDFTLQDSYRIADPPSFGEIPVDGKWMMYGGDGKKAAFSDNFDINFFDSNLWKDESGIFDHYKYGDFNMDADVNFQDSVLWKKNNGRYSKVPH